MTDRYVVTEIEGDLTPRPGSGPHPPTGLSTHVLDTLYCHRIVETFRTEDFATVVATPWERREWVRGLARARAMELNAA